MGEKKEMITREDPGLKDIHSKFDFDYTNSWRVVNTLVQQHDRTSIKC